MALKRLNGKSNTVIAKYNALSELGKPVYLMKPKRFGNMWTLFYCDMGQWTNGKKKQAETINDLHG